MINKTLSYNACYAGKYMPVPHSFNSPSNQLAIVLNAYSDVASVCIRFYEHHGVYWYSFRLESLQTLNSVGYVSLQNCVVALRETLRGLGFYLVGGECLSRFVRASNRQGRRVA